MKHPFFSIIIPTYNRKNYLKIAMESVFAQDFSDYELIVVDDGSTDGTEEMVKEYLGCRVQGVGCRTKYFYQSNKGPAAARNSGIREAQGTFICFLDSDDRFVHFKLSKTYENIQCFPKISIFHSDELWYRDGRYLEQKEYHAKPDGMCFEQALRICCISLSTAVIHRGVFSEIGVFDESFRSCEDYEFWLRALRSFPVKLIPEFLTIKDGGKADQQSQKYFGMDRFRVAAILKIIPLLTGGLKEKALKELVSKSRIYLQGAVKRHKKEEADHYQGIIRKAEEELRCLIHTH